MLAKRIVTAVVLLAALLSALFWLPIWGNAAIFALVTSVGAWEWAGLSGGRLLAKSAFPVFVLVGCGVSALAVGMQPTLWLFCAIFWIGVTPLWLIRRWSVPRGLPAYLIGGVLLVSTWSAVVFLLNRGHALALGPTLLLACMALVWIADTAAYFTGRLFGRHKLAPSISPGKTWEGVAGGVFGVLLAGLSISGFVERHLHISATIMMACLVLIAAVSVLGDLFESMFKRQAGVKDSGNLLPGHGGILDRIDSQLSALPVAALILSRSLP